MSRFQGLRVFITQRLTAAVEEVIGRLEKAMTEYEEELEARRQGPGADVQQQLVIKEEVCEQLEWIPSLDQEDPGHPHIKDEKQDFWVIQEVRGRDETLRQTEQSPEAVACSSAQHMKTDADAGDRRRPEPQPGFQSQSGSDDRTSHSSGAEDSGDRADAAPVKHAGPPSSIKPFSCSKCGRRFGQKHHLQAHMRLHTGEKPFGCSLCGKSFAQKGNLTQHLAVHTRDKPCNCPVCGERFSHRGNLTQHMTVHTREKLRW